MSTNQQREAWMRGPVPGIIPLLQPVAHALVQARDEVNDLMNGFDNDLLWVKPAGRASAAFHLQHMQGVLQRLFVYADGKLLTEAQLAQLKAEGQPQPDITTAELVNNFNSEVDKVLATLSNITEETLLQPRGIGRAQIPTNVSGLLFHAAEHTMRHLGQLIVTVAVVKETTAG